jgi:RNA polymerase sigma-70 factor, ECF subfamily
MSLLAPLSNTDTERWVGRAIAGELEAFNQLVLAYQNLAYNHAYALLGEHAAAEDVTQDSFIKAYRGLCKFRGGSFRAWLLKIVTNTAYDVLRRNRRQPVTPLHPEDDDQDEWESPPWVTYPAASAQSMVENEELSGTLHRLLRELSPDYQNVITLVDLHELDYGEAATALDIPVGTVKSRLARARLQMRSKLLNEMEGYQVGSGRAAVNTRAL